MGVVVRAFDTLFTRAVALKLMGAAEENTPGNFPYAFALNSSNPSQGIAISANQSIDSDSILLEREGIESFAGWFKEDCWEQGSAFDSRPAKRHSGRWVSSIPTS